jgi:hypothetical protein
MLQVCAGFEVGECDIMRPLVVAEAVQYNAPQLTIDIWMADKYVERPAKQSGRSVSTWSFVAVSIWRETLPTAQTYPRVICSVAGFSAR